MHVCISEFVHYFPISVTGDPGKCSLSVVGQSLARNIYAYGFVFNKH